MITPDKLILIDMLIEQVLNIGERIAKIKAMSDEEVTNALALENVRSKQLKDLLESDM